MQILADLLVSKLPLPVIRSPEPRFQLLLLKKPLQCERRDTNVADIRPLLQRDFEGVSSTGYVDFYLLTETTIFPYGRPVVEAAWQPATSYLELGRSMFQL